VHELLRGIRIHFTKFEKAHKDGERICLPPSDRVSPVWRVRVVGMLEKAQLGLGHSYSRAKVKFNVNRADNMIIQSIALLDQMDKDLNTFSMVRKQTPGTNVSHIVV
jgi:nucleolar protein 56